MKVKVLSLNIWNRSGPWKERAERIREWIAALDPDVIGLQEVLRGQGVDQAAELLEGRAYHLEFARAAGFWEDSDLEFGNAVASRWPIVDREELALTDGAVRERRVALSVTLDAPPGPIAFTTTHLAFRLYHGWLRERQVMEVCDLVLRRRPRGGFPPILCGDFNAEPDSSEMRYARGLQAIDGRSVHLRDAWQEAGTGDGTTWSNRNPYARTWREAERRIDYVLVGPPQRNGLGAVENCRVVCDDERDGVWPSDHFGVYAELRGEPEA